MLLPAGMLWSSETPDDGTVEICGVSDAAQDVVEFLSGSGRKVISWAEVEPRSDRPEIRPDRKC